MFSVPCSGSSVLVHQNFSAGFSTGWVPFTGLHLNIASVITRSSFLSSLKGSPSSYLVLNLDRLFVLREFLFLVSNGRARQWLRYATAARLLDEFIKFLSSVSKRALSSCPGAIFAASFDVKGFSFMLQWHPGFSGVRGGVTAPPGAQRKRF